MRFSLEPFLEHVRPADVIDILLMSVVLYWLLVWLWRYASPLAILVGALVAAVSVAARLFDMYLMSMLFQGLFAVLVIGLIILFQDDIRRALQRGPSWKWLRRGPKRSDQVADVDLLVEAVFHLAERRMGALIVLGGREPLDRHAAGGVPLEGRLSLPLLYSLFDPSSPGHDGAVLVEDQVVTRFGAHLPLSDNPLEVGSLGTRHSAALGLSERADALLLVVSEEQGTVGVAERGHLEHVESAAVLKDRIERFRKDRFPPPAATNWPARITRNWSIKLLALALASVAWLVFAYRPDVVERTLDVPIEYRNVPENLALSGYEPSVARITLSGSEAAFRLLDPATLKVSLDLSGLKDGPHDFAVVPEHVSAPSNLKISRIEPLRIRLWLTSRRDETGDDGEATSYESTGAGRTSTASVRTRSTSAVVFCRSRSCPQPRSPRSSRISFRRSTGVPFVV